MKKRLLFIFSIVFIILLGLVGFRLLKIENKVQDQQGEREENVFVIIDFGEEQISDFVSIKKKTTAFGVMDTLAQQNEIPIITEEFDFGVFVKAIGEREGSTEMAWIYFVNGEAGAVAADNFEVKNGDTIEWKYIKPN